ncbi:MAG: hypothetical protein ACYC5O_00535 [Anaerolineae bacterium]
MSRGPKVAVDVETVISVLAGEGKTAGQIEEYLSRDPLYNDRLPGLRTIQRIVKAARETDPSGPWTLEDSNPEDAQHVLGVLRFYHGWPGKALVTKDLADWIGRVARAAPTLPYRWVGRIALAYLHTAKGQTRDLDQFLAFRPWESQERGLVYNAYTTGGGARVPIAALPHSKPDIDWPTDMGTREQEEERTATIISTTAGPRRPDSPWLERPADGSDKGVPDDTK